MLDAAAAYGYENTIATLLTGDIWLDFLSREIAVRLGSRVRYAMDSKRVRPIQALGLGGRHDGLQIRCQRLGEFARDGTGSQESAGILGLKGVVDDHHSQ